MAKLIRVEMGDKKISQVELGDYARYGGRALTSMIVSREVPATCHPLDEKYKLVIATGLLSGTMAANAGRLSVGAKSPLTGGIKESNVGGTAAVKLAGLGIRGIVIEGQAGDGKLYYLLVSKDGTVKLSDFGIARLFGQARMTSPGSVLGTVEYMAPEQADARPVDRRADLYSLGGVLYALLARRPPTWAGGCCAAACAKTISRRRFSRPATPSSRSSRCRTWWWRSCPPATRRRACCCWTGPSPPTRTTAPGWWSAS